MNEKKMTKMCGRSAEITKIANIKKFLQTCRLVSEHGINTGMQLTNLEDG